jgi:hypothetical protein
MIPVDSDPKIAAKERMRRKIVKGMSKKAKTEAKEDPRVGSIDQHRLKNLAYDKLNTKKMRAKMC